MLHDLWPLFETHLFPVASTEEAFNPYRDRRAHLDVDDAPAVRRENLRAFLHCYDDVPPLFLLLEAPGPWGCRFSGVPITSEAQLTDPDFPIDGRRTSREDAPHTEYSASIFWRVCRPLFPHVFVWNSVPLHPHAPGEPLSIRTPRRTEVREWHPLLTDVLDVLRPARIVGVGRKAERALDEIGTDPTYVRHPSQGGANRFETGIREIAAEMGL